MTANNKSNGSYSKQTVKRNMRKNYYRKHEKSEHSKSISVTHKIRI